MLLDREALERIKRLAQEKSRPVNAYDLGYDCGINGPNSVNCHFGIFSTPEKMKEWERGKRDAENKSVST